MLDRLVTRSFRCSAASFRRVVAFEVLEPLQNLLVILNHHPGMGQWRAGPRHRSRAAPD